MGLSCHFGVLNDAGTKTNVDPYSDQTVTRCSFVTHSDEVLRCSKLRERLRALLQPYLTVDGAARLQAPLDALQQELNNDKTSA